MDRAALPLLAVPALVATALTLARAEDPPAIAWRTDLATAREEARAAGKPLFLYFRCER